MVKRRESAGPLIKGFTELYVGNTVYVHTPYERSSTYLQHQVNSKGHPFRRGRGGRGYISELRRLQRFYNADLGGPFWQSAAYRTPGASFIFKEVIGPGGLGHRVKGTMCATIASTGIASVGDFLLPSSDSILDGYGASGVARALPTNPLANMGQFLYELREPPRVPGRGLYGARPPNYNARDPSSWRDTANNFRRLARGGSDEFLNHVFGWVPFIQDMTDFFVVTNNLGRQAHDYHAHSGQDIRRRRTVIDTTSVTGQAPIANQYPYPALDASHYRTPGIMHIQVTTSQKVWFSGAFTYYLPPADNFVHWFNRYENFAHRFYGLRLDPDLLWRIAPWSWAADWFTNTGDVVRNLSAFNNDGLVMRYGYVMEHLRKETVYDLVGCTWADGTPASFRDTVVLDTKSRRGANPYGFGVNPGSLTPRQSAIIGALGINRWTGWR